MNLLNLALAPTLIILFYIYIRDKYEKEPIRLLILGIVYGIIISFPIVFTENFIMRLASNFKIQQDTTFYKIFISFFVASLVEEMYKYLFIYFFIWKNKNFNEEFDGIVYSVFLSLGFAGVENILYVLNPRLGGVYTAIGRAIFSVPAHAFFGVFMGYFFSQAKFKNIRFSKIKAYIIPFFIHGLYDILLISKMKYNEVFFIFLVIYIWISGFKKIKKCINNSPFKNT